jgi:hypothetical protein
MRLRDGLAVGLAAAVLAGCGSSDTASFMIDGSDTALTLERIKPYAWSDGWELELIVRRNPDCQRRHTLKAATSDAPKVELYTPEPYVFIVRQAKRWYVTDMKTCQLQAFKEAPPLPGTLVGVFQEKDGILKFVLEPQAKPAEAGQPPS